MAHTFEASFSDMDICRLCNTVYDNKQHCVNPFPGQTLRKVDEWSNMYECYREEIIPGDIAKAQIVCSDMWVQLEPGWYSGTELEGMESKHHRTDLNRHKPILDIDFEAKLLPSTTEGHYHLFLDKEMSWELYEELLTTLAKCGIIEQGYANASIQRHYSAARLPWVKKEKHLNPNHPDEESPF